MQFSPVNFALTAAMTSGVDEPRRSQINLVGGMMGPSPVGALLLGAAVAGRDTATEGPKRLPGGRTTRPRMAQVPAVPRNVDQAEERIRSRGLEPTVTPVVGEEGFGQAIGTLPEAGEIVPLGSHVAILVGNGLEIPDVVGKELADAIDALKKAGFESIEYGEAEAGTVEEQAPEPGNYVNPAQTVTLTVVEEASEEKGGEKSAGKQ
jgi:PASTA domain-containing protein